MILQTDRYNPYPHCPICGLPIKCEDIDQMYLDDPNYNDEDDDNAASCKNCPYYYIQCPEREEGTACTCNLYGEILNLQNELREREADIMALTTSCNVQFQWKEYYKARYEKLFKEKI